MADKRIPEPTSEGADRRAHSDLVKSLASALNVSEGLADALDIAGYRKTCDRLAGLLDLDAGLRAALAASVTKRSDSDGSTETERPRGDINAGVRTMITVAAPDLPCHMSIMAVDIESSTARSNSAQAQLRGVMYELFEEALQVSGIAKRHRDALIDRGDGILALIRPVDQVPKALLLNSVIPTLSKLLTAHGSRYPDNQFRLRAVVHAGEVHYDRRGCFGEALDITFRLLDAAEVKRKLRQTTASLVLVVSDDIYHSVIRQGYPGIDETSFEPLVHVRIADQQHLGWINVPGRSQMVTATPR
jgi:hypothetical protein